MNLKLKRRIKMENEQGMDRNTIMREIVIAVDWIINRINEFVPCRPGSIAITRLEEAVLWANVMLSSSPLKVDELKNEDSEKKDEADNAA